MFRRRLALLATIIGIIVQIVEVLYNYILKQKELSIINLFILSVLILIFLFFKRFPTKPIAHILVLSLILKIVPLVFFFSETLFPWIILFPLISIVLVGIQSATIYTFLVAIYVVFILSLKREYISPYQVQFYFEVGITYFTSFVIGAVYETLNRFFYNQLKKQAVKDFLTGLFNRRYFEEILKWEIELSKRYNHPLSIILLDIDNFKKVNDMYGHQVGDRVLREIADVLKKNIRSSDIAARYGGEEFVILLPETDVEGAVKVAEKLRTQIQNLKPNGIEITASFGVTKLFGDDTVETFIKRADTALYQAKRKGKNRVISLLK
ncbi:MAG: diguanylate cyclase [Aquificae bacterium]|nr:diguanylate cyclase [Aquificota bacterium]